MKIDTSNLVYGFTCGAFDLLHPGHLHLLESASKHCDLLTVGLHTDPSIERSTKNKPIQTTFERYQQLIANKHVYQVIPYDTERDLENMLCVLPINVRFVGTDYQLNATAITGYNLCIDLDIEIIYIRRYHSYSSSELRSRLK